MKELPLRRLGLLTGGLVFALAAWALHTTLAEYRYQDMVAYLDALPRANLLAACALTALGYFAVTGYDWLALRYVHKRLSPARVLFASFVSYAFSNTIGLSVLASGSVRLRLYSAWGLSTVDIAKVVAFSAVTLWLGILACGGGALLLEPLDLPELLHLPLRDGRVLGALLLLVPLAYLGLGALRREPLRLGAWELPVPRARLAAAQLAIGAADWALAAAVLYALLPSAETFGFAHFLAAFVVAQVVALVSHVPGGLGVFESVVIALLGGELAAADLLGGLLAFRAVYYLAPLALATALLGLHESAALRARLAFVPRLLGPALPLLAPSVLALMTLACGAVLLLSVASPAEADRLAWLRHWIPLPLLELSHFLGSVVGMGLLLLAQGLQRRLDAAWWLSCGLLGAGIAASLLKGVDYEEAALLGVMLAVLLACRRHFYRRASLLAERFTLPWLAAIAVVGLAALWLGLFAYREVDYSSALWWQFSFGEGGEAPRFLRATVGAAAVVLVFAGARLLRPAVPTLALPDLDALARVQPLIDACPHGYAHLARVRDKALLLGEAGFLMYGVHGRSWVAMGDPIGTAEERRELAWRFRERVEEHAGWTVFYQVSPANLDLYLELGLTLLKIGEEARVPLAEFSLEGRARKTLRNTVARAEREGARFRVLAPAEVLGQMAALEAVSETWLASKATREKRFSLGRFDAAYLAGGPVAVVEREGEIVAFANLWCGGGREELSVDLMRQGPGAPAGSMDYLFAQLMLWGRSQGYRWFNLGMAPLAGLHNRSLAPLWNRFGSLVFGRGERFYNFRGVRQYKEKFSPMWEPRYLALPGGLPLPRILANVAALIAGGLPGVIQK